MQARRRDLARHGGDRAIHKVRRRLVHLQKEVVPGVADGHLTTNAEAELAQMTAQCEAEKEQLAKSLSAKMQAAKVSGQ